MLFGFIALSHKKGLECVLGFSRKSHNLLTTSWRTQKVGVIELESKGQWL